MCNVSLEKWKIFEALEEQLRQNIRLAIVFGRYDGDNAIFVTKDDALFVFGTNENGCLGTGDANPVSEPRKIDALCSQRIESLEHGRLENECRIYAICASGSVFAWGQNKHGQLGLGTTASTLTPTKIRGCLEGKRVLQVACGPKHTLALTSDGEVYAFGCGKNGQLGLGRNDDKCLPTKVAGELAGRFATAIACGWDASVALLDSGEVFAWGLNREDSLALACEETEQKTPRRVVGLEGVQISKIACGLYHALALSRDGKLFSWGFNVDGQLGNGSRRTTSIPTLISTPVGRVTDIAAANCYISFTCAALTEENVVYIWGRFKDDVLWSPISTSFVSLDAVYAAVALPAVTFRPWKSS